MNYLAHLLLGSATEDRLVGSFLGDFVKGRLEHLPYEGELLRGIELHRKVDSFTDEHPITARSRERFAPERRRFAGIAVDLAYDHFLARHWSRFSSEPLAQFAAQSYRLLEQHQATLPLTCTRIVHHMAREDWLTNYRHLWLIERSLVGISRRRPRFEPLADCGVELEQHYVDLEQDFLAFFPELLQFVATEGR